MLTHKVSKAANTFKYIKPRVSGALRSYHNKGKIFVNFRASEARIVEKNVYIITAASGTVTSTG